MGQVFVLKDKTRWIDGQLVTVESGYIAHFQRRRTLHPWEEDQARRTFSFRGVGTLRDQMTPLDPVRERVSLWDSEWAPAERREEIEQAMLNHPDYGTSFVLVDPPNVPKPWPDYDDIKGEDEYVTAQIMGIVTDTGIDPAKVIEYEKYNDNRGFVIAALEKIGEPEDDTVEVPA